MKGLFVGVLAMAWAAGAMADGTYLLGQCQQLTRLMDSNGAAGDSFGAGYCLGVINGVTSLRGLTNPGFPKHLQTCLPDTSVSGNQAARIVVKYLNEHPEQLHMDDGALVLFALQLAFPCKA